jgi:predicted nuclease with TOPRIM domain
MYISTWIIVAIIIAGIYFYSRSHKRKTLNEEYESLTTEQMWNRAEEHMTNVLEKSPNLENYLQTEREMVKAMEKDMVRLRERFKHDAKKQNEIARDWMDYSSCVGVIKQSRELLDVDTRPDASDRYDRLTKVPYVIIQEVAKRVEDMLGQDSSSKLVHDKLKKNAQAIEEVFAERRARGEMDGVEVDHNQKN